MRHFSINPFVHRSILGREAGAMERNLETLGRVRVYSCIMELETVELH
jgi:hypothetical protein